MSQDSLAVIWEERVVTKDDFKSTRQYQMRNFMSNIHTTRQTISLMKRQFVVTHTIRQTEMPALLDSCVTNTPSVKTFYPQKIASPYIFIKT